MFAFIAANFNAKLKLVRSRTQDPSGMSTAGGNSSRNGSIKERFTELSVTDWGYLA